MTTKIIIDPITRISGFLEIEVEVDNHKIINAKSKGLLYRGFETMLIDRAPLDAIYFTERICGICSCAHSIASTLALEDALKVIPDENGLIIRDIIHGCEFLQNHIRHFYLYTIPDYSKVPDLTTPNPDISSDFRLPDKYNKQISEDYIKAIDFSKAAHELLALLGGKAPHNHGVFVGGATIDLNASKIIKAKYLISSIKEFIKTTMLEDLNIISEYYNDYFKNGATYNNLMTYGVFNNYKEKELFYVNAGTSFNYKACELDPSNITENIYYSWYKLNDPNEKPANTSTKADLSKTEGYTWIKAPRYNGKPVEVGPLARMIISGNYKNSISTMDRISARVLETLKIASILELLIDKLKLGKAKQDKYNSSIKSQGKGLIDTTRGSLGHWITIKNNKIQSYNIITPSGWNLSPKDSNGVKGVLEKALIGTYIDNEKNPIEIGRIVRSFDPCVSCATHVLNSSKRPIISWVI